MYKKKILVLNEVGKCNFCKIKFCQKLQNARNGKTIFLKLRAAEKVILEDEQFRKIRF